MKRVNWMTNADGDGDDLDDDILQDTLYICTLGTSWA
jgi:hypothetical protein